MKELESSLDPDIKQLLSDLAEQIQSAPVVSSRDYLAELPTKKVTEKVSWKGRQASDRGYALKFFFSNNILLAKDKKHSLHYISINGRNKLTVSSDTGELPYGMALKVILWLCDEAYKQRSLDISQSCVKIISDKLGLCYHTANRKMILKALCTLRETSFCFTEDGQEVGGDFKIIDDLSYKENWKSGNKLTIKLTREFLSLIENPKLIRAFDYNVMKKIGQDYTTLHLYLFAVQRSYRPSGEAHISVKEFLRECGSVFSNIDAFYQKLKNTCIPKLTQILEEVYGVSFRGVLRTAVNIRTKIKRLILKTTKAILPRPLEALKPFLKRCHESLKVYGLLALQKLSEDDLSRLYEETGKHVSDLVRLSPHQLQKLMVL